MPILSPLSSEGRKFEKTVLKPAAAVLLLVKINEGGK
nr:MAG TPA: hypothetical protein [Caudoviricetes sp.]